MKFYLTCVYTCTVRKLRTPSVLCVFVSCTLHKERVIIGYLTDVMSLRLFACSSATATGRIFVKFHNWDFY
jgi:hypothetical protein